MAGINEQTYKDDCMIIAGIATIPERTNELKNTLESICPQVNVVYVYQNGVSDYIDVPPNVILVSGSDIGDAGKFYPMREMECDYFFSCDDDLIYPPDYVEKLKYKIDHYTEIYGGVIVSTHGRHFPHAPIKSYYRDYAVKFRCLDEVLYDTEVQFGGTGAMAFKPDYFRPTHFPTSNMADIHFAIQAKKENKKIMCIAHSKNWIQYQQVSNTIYERFKFDDSVQTQFANSVTW